MVRNAAAGAAMPAALPAGMARQSQLDAAKGGTDAAAAARVHARSAVADATSAHAAVAAQEAVPVALVGASQLCDVAVVTKTVVPRPHEPRSTPEKEDCSEAAQQTWRSPDGRPLETHGSEERLMQVNTSP